MSRNKISNAKQDGVKKIALIAGAGFLPLHVYNASKKAGMECLVIGLNNQTDTELFQDIDIETFPLHAVSRILNTMKQHGIKHVVLAGKVKRANVSKLLLDVKGAKLFARIIKNGLSDDCLLSTILAFLEDEGFTILAPDHIAKDLVVEKGCMTKTKPDEEAHEDIKKGLKILKGISQYDVGQALVIQTGLILGVEAAEGTDELIKRCGIIQQKDEKKPVLIKVLKVQQDKRVDLPCIGKHTVEMMHVSNIRGVAIEAGHTYILNKKETLELADKYKIFIYGF